MENELSSVYMEPSVDEEESAIVELENMIDFDVEEEDECVMIEGRNSSTEILKPMEGMDFASLEEIMSFYATYARKLGFAIFKRSTKRCNGIVSYVILQCTRGANHKSKSNNLLKMRPTSKTDCKAKITALCSPAGTWLVSTVELNHNHEMSPSKSRFYKCNRHIESNVKKRLLLNDKAGIPMNKSFNSIVVASRGHENVPFTERDARNYVRQVRHLQLVEGDANAMYNYFEKMQSDNSDFYYLMDLDDEGRLKNVFWADARSRAAFKEFGDVVTFDTTYLVNKYDMPFAPFVGVNHHGQSVLLGCGLVSSENADTFIWLFQSWLKCMSGCSPSAIITDQDRAMKKAIEVVFPNARHRWCLWHIMRKLPEKLKGYNEYKSIKYAMKRAVHNSLSRIEFEDAWGEFINKFQLQDNEWLSGLYNERHCWIPSFLNDGFWAGMSTTQRSESMNSFFDGYIHSKTTLKQFVEQYENALGKRVESEKLEDFNSYNSTYSMVSLWLIEKKFQSAYTRTKFKEFQEQFNRKSNCHLTVVKEDIGDNFEYQVRERVEIKDFGYRTVSYKVIFNDYTKNVDCDCQLFESAGIMCTHQLVVYNHRELYDELPGKYFLKRWNKNVKRRHTKIRISYDNWSDRPEVCHYEKMCNEFSEVAEVASGNQDWTDDVMSLLFSMKATIKEKADSCGDGISCSKATSHRHPDDIIVTKESAKIIDPFVTRSKGRPPTKRIVGNVEKVAKKKSSSRKKANTLNIGVPNTIAAGSFAFQSHMGVGGNFPYTGYQNPFWSVGGVVGAQSIQDSNYRNATFEAEHSSQGAQSTQDLSCLYRH